MSKRVLYEERTGWAWWVHFLIGLTFLPALIAIGELWRVYSGAGSGSISTGTTAFLLLVGFGLPLGLYSLVGELRTRVTPGGVEIRWGLLEVIRKTIPFESIGRAQVLKYSPLAEFGGWGIRVGGGKKKAWTIRGNRALVLHLDDGTRFYIGSERPERLLQWIAPAINRREE